MTFTRPLLFLIFLLVVVKFFVRLRVSTYNKRIWWWRNWIVLMCAVRVPIIVLSYWSYWHHAEVDQFIRPPVYGSNGRTYKMLVMFLSFFFSPRVLRFPSTDRPETLPHDQNLAVFYKPTPKIKGALPPPPQKIGGQKHAKFRSILDHFRLWSRISPERLKISKIGRRYKLWEFLLRLTKKVRWTLVH